MNTTRRFNLMHDAFFATPGEAYTPRDEAITILRKQDETFAWKYRICKKWLDSSYAVQKKHKVAHLCGWIEWQISEFNS